MTVPTDDNLKAGPSLEEFEHEDQDQQTVSA
jgi:hypothetical protein